MIDQLLESMRVVALPTKTDFRGITVREVALFKGPHGWAEFSPFLEYDEVESARWLACAIEAATTPAPKLYRDRVKVNGTIPALNDAARIEEIVNSYPGCTTFKVKVGSSVEEDLARLSVVRNLNPYSDIRVDVNGSWSVEEAVSNIERIEGEIGMLAYVEQPCATVEELRELKKRIDVHIAGDEVLRKTANPFAIDLKGAVDVLMLKVQPLGGIKKAHQLAEHHGLPVVISSALESAVGIQYGLELAASINNLSFDCGLATGSLLARDVAQLPIANGEIALKELEIDLDGLDVDAERYEWWKNRAMRAAAVLGIK